ncbi:S1 family peptidase [Microbispora amethystogenes]|uniref:S1 family peptidase n=1 Tax=Microbispora amethystogenes TaxID=1427754 RepID=UPI0033E1E17C
MLRRRTVTAACALAVTALATVATPAMAEPSNSSASSSAAPSPGMIQAMQRDLGLSANQANARLANEAKAMNTDAKVRATLGEAYAGSWVSGVTSDSLIVATTDASKAGAILSAGAQPTIVARNLGALDAAEAALDKAAAGAPASAASLWYVDVRTNSVVVLASDTAAAEKLVAASGVDKSAVRVERSSEAPQTFYDVRGGDAYYIGSSARCSIGFSVRKGSTPGFVDAGHCATVGSTVYGYNHVLMGTFQGYSFPGNDYSWAAVNSNWTVRPWVNNYSGGNVTVSGSSVAGVGSSICRSGSTTGWHCGTVQQLNASVRYSQGTVSGLTRTSVCAEPGDSGGSFISGSQAQGVTSGGSGNCSSGGTTYFQPVNEILSVYGLTLVTG